MTDFYLKNNQISKDLWNKSLNKCINANTYCYSWYLDTVANDWDAIVSEKYDILMPLPISGKFHFNVYQPLLTPKLGIFYSREISKTELNLFVSKLPQNIKNIKLNFNKFNTISLNKNILKKETYSIDLYSNYIDLFNNYSNYIKHNLENAKNKKYYVINGIAPNEIIAFLNKTNYYENTKNYDILRRVLSLTTLRRLSKVTAAFSEKNELIGIAIYILSANLIDLVVASAISNDEEIYALLFDKFFQINANKNLTLNLEIYNNDLIERTLRELGSKKYYFGQLSIRKKPLLLKIFSKKD